MIDRNDLIESADQWWRHPYSIPNDRLLCSFVSLRLLTADIFECVRRSFSFSRGQLLSSLQRQIESWENKWLSIIESGMWKYGELAINQSSAQEFNRDMSFIFSPVLWSPSTAAIVHPSASRYTRCSQKRCVDRPQAILDQLRECCAHA